MVSFRDLGDAIEIRQGHEIVRVTAWGIGGARIQAAQFRIADGLPGALDERPAHGHIEIRIGGGEGLLVNGDLTVIVDSDTTSDFPQPRLTFRSTTTGELLLQEQRVHFSMPGCRIYQGNRGGAYAIDQVFEPADERLYGMGQRTHGRLDLKGLSLDLVHRNAEVSIPFVLSSRGYGMLWNHPGTGRVDFASNSTRWHADQARGIDYWVVAGGTPSAILERYADATGHAPELPSWASGFWQSKLRYRTQDELLAVAREHRRRGLPLSVIVADFFHWTAMGDYRFDPEQWPDVPAMVRELDELDVKLMVSIWPTVSPLSEHIARYRDDGLLLGADRGMPYQLSMRDKGMATPLPVSYYDPTNPDTRAFVWDLVRRNYLVHGIDVFWLDASEPELNPADPDNVMLFAGPGSEAINIYPRDNARLFAEGMAAAGREPTVLLTRSAWAGSQRYGVAVWSGDVPATWDSLNTQVRAGLNIAISGIPWWTTDIGGFHGGDSRDADYRELLVRWFEYGTFCPLFRLHGDRMPRVPVGHDMTGGPNEVWSYGDEALPILTAHLELRERLRPYLHEQMRHAASAGIPPMRPLFVDFPRDPQAWEIDDQFLLGPDLLVAPILAAGKRARRVYLPAGVDWVDTASGEQHDGGGWREVDAPLERIPVFARSGSAVQQAFNTR
ncbi:glycoside hydrolase family 31 protein [Glaciibacter superstes]|uniref:glycoside hydrolase family 31 protein n=1 Tax=Glaciibacter superstes TaxID=501023 RepID=UPI0003B51700|nr:TIM-barrel domain-containing protein [Glaciibacter superstes]